MHEQLLDFLFIAHYQGHSQSTRSLLIPGSAHARRSSADIISKEIQKLVPVNCRLAESGKFPAVNIRRLA